MDEKISVIVPVYNAEKTLERCVHSLLGQSYGNVEIILVNDGSKDGSLDLCRRFAQKDVRVRVIDKPNGGVSSARNAGLDAARGELVMFCDSDDWVSPQWCEAMLRSHVPGDLTVCAISWGGSDGSEPEALETQRVAQRKEFLHYPALMSSPVNKIYDKSVIQTHGLRFIDQLRLGEDFVFVLDYLCHLEGQVRFLSQKLYYYDTSTEGSLSGRSATMEQCDLFYRLVTAAMEKLDAMDPESLYNRDRHVMSQFENMLIAAAENRDLSLARKLRIAGKTGKLESFRSCDSRVITWENPFFLWLLEKKYARLSMLYLILRAWKTRLCTRDAM